jgi:hypothetical protein
MVETARRVEAEAWLRLGRCGECGVDDGVKEDRRCIVCGGDNVEAIERLKGVWTGERTGWSFKPLPAKKVRKPRKKKPEETTGGAAEGLGGGAGVGAAAMRADDASMGGAEGESPMMLFEPDDGPLGHKLFGTGGALGKGDDTTWDAFAPS